MLVFQGTPYLSSLKCELLHNTDCSLLLSALQHLLLVLVLVLVLVLFLLLLLLAAWLLAWTQLTRAQGNPA